MRKTLSILTFSLLILSINCQTTTTFPTTSSLPLYCLAGNGLYAGFYDTLDIVSPYVAFDFNASPNKANDNNLPSVNITAPTDWSVAYSGIYTTNQTGTYQIVISSDDGGRVSLDASRLTGNYGTHGYKSYPSNNIVLDANEPYLMNIEYFQTSGTAGLQMAAILGGNNYVIPYSQYKPCFLNPPSIATTDCSSRPIGLFGSYYTTSTLTGTPFFTRIDAFNAFKFDYPTGSPNSSFPTNNWGIQYRGAFRVPTTGLYRIQTLSPQFNRIRVANIIVLENGVDVDSKYKTSPLIRLEGGKFYSIDIDYSKSVSATTRFNIYFDRVGFDGVTLAAPNTYFRACLHPAIVSPIRVSTTTLNYATAPVVLRTQPTSNVIVTITPSNDTQGFVTPCTLTFTPSNWNVPQIVKLKTLSTGQYFTFSGSSNDTSYNTTATNSITYVMGVSNVCGASISNPLPGSTCTSWGDPHFITFDGSHFDFQGVGDYYLVRSSSSNFVVQARQSPCGAGTVTCNYIAAIKYNNAIMRIFISASTGVPVLTYNSETNLLGPGFSVTQQYKDYIFNFPNGIVVNVASSYWAAKKSYYLSIYITLTTAFKGQVYGLCGTYDGKANNDYHTGAGISSSFSTFTTYWAVPANETIIDSYTSTIPALVSSTSSLDCDFGKCQAVPNLPPPSGDTPQPPQPPGPACTINPDVAKSYCSSIFTESLYATECAKIGVNLTSFYTTCVSEILNMCDTTAAGPLACSFQIACKNTTQPQCECLCNLEGVCNANGKCSCSSGFQGDKCNINENSLPCSSQVTPLRGSPGDRVIVYVSNLQTSSSLSCVFGSQITTDAYLVSPTSVSCQVPPFLGASGQTVQVYVRENGLGLNCGAVFTYYGTCSSQSECYSNRVQSISYNPETSETTICYNVTVKNCLICTDASLFIKTNCREELYEFTDNGNFTSQDGSPGWQFTDSFGAGAEEIVCLNILGIVELRDRVYIMTVLDGTDTMYTGVVKSPVCDPTPTSPPTTPPCYSSTPSRYYYQSTDNKTYMCFNVTVSGTCDTDIDFECGISGPTPFSTIVGWNWYRTHPTGTTKEYCVSMDGNITTPASGFTFP